MTWSRGVEKALWVAHSAHDGQVRKGPDQAPYVTHSMHVALMVARWGADDEVVQAALLHDVVEDCDDWTLERLESVFGERVAHIVDQLSEDKSQTWEERKLAALEGVPSLSPEALVVKAADKLHNLQSLLAELRRPGDDAAVWARFTGGRERTLAMDRRIVDALAEALRAADRGDTAADLEAVMSDLEATA